MGSGGAQDYSQIIYRHSTNDSEQLNNAAAKCLASQRSDTLIQFYFNNNALQ